jgi:hypothetical protein
MLRTTPLQYSIALDRNNANVKKKQAKKIAADPPKYSNQIHIKRLLFTPKRITARQH